ncbi:MAG: hypothetical protein H6Q60_714 [Oscillospiraceae bacterium]|nr:hypothetical protein [Oscillospiraceae bacterium]
MTYKRFLKRNVILTDSNNLQWYGTVNAYTPGENIGDDVMLELITEYGIVGFSVSNINAILEA